MDKWKFFDITHTFHQMMNPLGSGKIDHLIDLLNIQPNSRVVDIACGKGEFLIRLAKNIDIIGTGVDLSPYTIRNALALTTDRAPNAQITYIEQSGAKFVESNTEIFDLSCCMGASWTFTDLEGTLKALISITKKDGIIIVGEPFFMKPPSAWYMEATGMTESEYGSHHSNITVGEELGLRFMYSLVSSLDEWDEYEMLQSLGVDHHIRNNPQDPDNEELQSEVLKNRIAYVKEGREIFGSALYVFRKV